MPHLLHVVASPENPDCSAKDLVWHRAKIDARKHIKPVRHYDDWARAEKGKKNQREYLSQASYGAFERSKFRRSG